MLNVWGSWCPTCRDEHPELTALRRNRARSASSATTRRTRRTTRCAGCEQFGNPFELIIADEDGRAALDWGIYGAPETFLVDGNGIVRWKHVGPMTDAVISEQIWPALAAMEKTP